MIPNKYYCNESRNPKNETFPVAEDNCKYKFKKSVEGNYLSKGEKEEISSINGGRIKLSFEPELVKLAFEYFLLSCSFKPSVKEVNRLCKILELAQVDEELNCWITVLDELIYDGWKFLFSNYLRSEDNLKRFQEEVYVAINNWDECRGIENSLTRFLMPTS